MPETVVMKFGGTSVGTVDRIKAVAERVTDHIKRTGDRVVLVVSAMSGETDKLVGLCRSVGDGKFSIREYDQMVASGEQVSSAMTAIAIEALGFRAQSVLGFQLPLTTKRVSNLNLIWNVNSEKLRTLLDQGIIPVVAGFQGIDDEGSVTTLGRGGSDATAVAVAAALDSCKCIILTDVEGVYTTNPSICKKAKKSQSLSYEEMLELASTGAKVLQTRSVNLARKFKVPVIVCSSFSNAEGTEIVERYNGMEDAVVSGISYRTDEAKVTVRDLPNKVGVAAQVLRAMSDVGVVVDMIVQSEATGNKAEISFTVPEGDTEKASSALKKLVDDKFSGATVAVDNDIAKVAVVGEGMRMHAGVAAEMFEVLAKENINVDMISTSEIKITVAIERKYAELAVRSLHEHFVENR